MLDRELSVGDEGPEKRLSLGGMLPDTLGWGIVAIDAANRAVAAFTPEAERLLGLAAKDVLRRDYRTVLPAELTAILDETLKSRQGIPGRWIRARSGAGDRTFSVSTLVPEGQGPVVAVVNDVTAVVKIESRLQRHNNLASAGILSASLAHEIKNALVAVKTFLETLVEDNRSVDLAKVAAREFDRINSIVGQMLRFSGTAAPKLARVRLHDVLDQSLRLIQHQAAEGSMTVQRSFTATSDVIHGDTYQLEQAFINLFINALSAMRAGGELTVATADAGSSGAATGLALGKQGRGVRVTVTDSGSGMDAEVLEHLFEPFFTTKPDGTGLGLPIARRIIQEHGGSISVKSEVGKGTAFTIDLPLLNGA